ncbi:phage baseplate assembly protein [Cupriavidus pauculus]|uniref:phage baseplate assembly protein n=1 Tax=Cupriavidus pauculus TaxID=82633 RepID=UPI001EE36C81|nr:Mu P family protein [Cupriavidus pauculus]GJG92831.1 Mu P family protein [Cupriavidus pauculus]
MADDVSLNEASLVIGAQARALKGWQQIRITRGIERMPSDFSITMSERFVSGGDVSVSPGDSFQLRLGADLVMTGYVDTVSPALSDGAHSISVAGRSKCADLVDCAAEWPGMQIVNSNIQQIATQLAVPYTGLGVVCDVTDMPYVQQLNIMLGETPYSVLERVARYSAVLLYDNAEGNLVITRVGDRVAAGGFAEGINVESIRGVFSVLDRFSEYMAVQQALDMLSDLSGGSLNVITRVADQGVTRRRQRVIVAENLSAIGIEVTQRRAVWEMNRRIARGNIVTLTTDSWRDADGALWEPNTLVHITAPTVKVPDAMMLIGSVTYRLDESGTHADLVLMPSDAFTPEPYQLQPQFADVIGTDVRGIQ